MRLITGALQTAISPTRIISVCTCSNLLGLYRPMHRLCRAGGALLLVPPAGCFSVALCNVSHDLSLFI